MTLSQNLARQKMGLHNIEQLLAKIPCLDGSNAAIVSGDTLYWAYLNREEALRLGRMIGTRVEWQRSIVAGVERITGQLDGVNFEIVTSAPADSHLVNTLTFKAVAEATV